jgi:hypothetical protein
VLTRIKIDKAAIDLVAAQGFGTDDVPPEGKMIKLTLTWNSPPEASRSTALSSRSPRVVLEHSDLADMIMIKEGRRSMQLAWTQQLAVLVSHDRNDVAVARLADQ